MGGHSTSLSEWGVQTPPPPPSPPSPGLVVCGELLFYCYEYVIVTVISGINYYHFFKHYHALVLPLAMSPYQCTHTSLAMSPYQCTLTSLPMSPYQCTLTSLPMSPYQCTHTSLPMSPYQYTHTSLPMSPYQYTHTSVLVSLTHALALPLPTCLLTHA